MQPMAGQLIPSKDSNYSPWAGFKESSQDPLVKIRQDSFHVISESLIGGYQDEN